MTDGRADGDDRRRGPTAMTDRRRRKDKLTGVTDYSQKRSEGEREGEAD